MPAARVAAAGAPAYLHIAFPNDPTLASVARTYRNYLRAKALPGEMQRPSHFHITLLYLSAATDEQVDALFDGVGLPLAFRPEFVRPSLLKSSLVLLVDPEPGLIGVQRMLWHRAQAVGCGMDEAGYSNPESYLPHVSLINDVNPAFDVADLPKHPALPFHLSASRIVIGREDYDAVRSVRMPASAGDRILIEKGGPWVWPTEPRPALPLEQAKALLRGEAIVHRRRIFTLGEPLVILGGPGSGHFGHEGRPGEVGGSAASGAKERWTENVRIGAMREEKLSLNRGAEAKNWWLSPDGTIYNVAVTHDDTAEDIIGGGGAVEQAVEELGVKSNMTPILGGDVLLQAFGWIRGGQRDRSYGSVMFTDLYRYPTDDQVAVVQSLYGLIKPYEFVVEDSSNGTRDFSRQKAEYVFGDLPGFRERGGPGSGHFGHEGRPGEVGGSTPGVGQGMTADWTPDYLGTFRAAVEGGLRNEKTYVPGTRALNGWMIGPDGRTFEVGFGNHDTAFADALMHASIEQPFQGWRKAMDEAEIPKNLPDNILDRMTDLMYDAGFIAVDEHTDRTGEGPVILAFKGRAPQTMAQRRAIKDMVLSGDTAPEFEFKTPSGDYMEGDTLWKFEQAIGISMRGGPGSGHFGHEGRPGERGGSLPGGGRKEISDRFPRHPVAFYIGLKDAQQANSWGLRHGRSGTQDWEDDFNATLSLRDYVQYGHIVLNRLLRDRQRLGRATRSTLGGLDDLMAHSQVDEPVVAWRGVGRGFFSSLREGRNFVDRGFVSTTLLQNRLYRAYSPAEADPWGDAGFEAHVEIEVPSGTPAYYVGRGQGGSSSSEYELLLDRNLIFEVRNVDRAGKVATVRVVGQRGK